MGNYLEDKKKAAKDRNRLEVLIELLREVEDTGKITKGTSQLGKRIRKAWNTTPTKLWDMWLDKRFELQDKQFGS